MNNRGFTFVELLISISIIGMFLAFIVPNYRGNQDKKALSFGVYQIKDDIRRTQSFSSNLKKFDDILGYPDGYGIQFYQNSNSYRIFADFESGRETFETIYLPNNIKTTDEESNAFTLFFVPPYGEILKDGVPDSFSPDPAVITIRIGADGQTAVVKVTSTGLLE